MVGQAPRQVHASFDRWTSPNHHTFLRVSSHFLDKNATLQQRLIALRQPSNQIEYMFIATKAALSRDPVGKMRPLCNTFAKVSLLLALSAMGQSNFPTRVHSLITSRRAAAKLWPEWAPSCYRRVMIRCCRAPFLHQMGRDAEDRVMVG